MRQFEEGFYIGPDLSEGPLPTIFYFALSAEESLRVDPFNQPAAFLEPLPMRVFSLDLPSHGPGLPAVDAIAAWAEEIERGNDVLTSFVKKAHTMVHALEQQGMIEEGKLAMMGLSRGAFIACHVAADLPQVKTLLGFAPLTQLTFAREFEEMRENPIAEQLNAYHLIPKLADRTVRFYIGNLDKRVGTHRCFQFIESLSEAALQKRIRSPQIELYIKPSIGHQGHGTPKETFIEGAAWIARQLGIPL